MKIARERCSMSALIPFSEVQRLDAELVRLGRGVSALRLAVGAALAALSSFAGHHELGFSSFEAYARERCQRSGRWAADTRALACKLEGLQRTRDALLAGEIGWSTAELLARHVSHDSELEWLERARQATVRELRLLLTGENGAQSSASEEEEEAEAMRTLAVSATQEDGWMFECARKVAEAVAGPMSADRLLQSLLAEGYSTLLEVVPSVERSGLYDMEGIECDVADELEAQALWCAESRRWRSEAEVHCEPGSSIALESTTQAVDEATYPEVSLATTPEALDREIRRLCAELSERDLALGIVAGGARKAEVWRRLGFATEAQYARERVGVSLSSLKAKRILAGRAARVPDLATALSSGRIGYEAAYLLSRVVTPRTVEEWIHRAEQRTVKHLREEVGAAELLIRMGLGRDQSPLDEASLEPLFELERRIVSGELFECQVGGLGNDARVDGERRGVGQTSGAISKGECEVGEQRGWRQMPGARRDARAVQKFGRVKLRWEVTEKTQRFFRALERVFVRVSSRVCRSPASFLRFLCENFCGIWLPALRRQVLTDSGELPEYFGVYRRDAFRCTSPVCTRRDVTPHHLTFRSHGGGDEDENVASLCVWCHLHGVHEGRIAAAPPASRIQWRIGRRGTLRVEGRTRVSA
jgi:hypothetical protein